MEGNISSSAAALYAANAAFEEAIGEVAAVGVKPGMEVIRELLKQLGNPHKKIPIIHVAGTNGKGSVCAMLERCLREAGFRTGLYTSPHMMTYHERFLVDGEMISHDALMALLKDVEVAVEDTKEALGQNPREFEILTAMGFLWFYRKRVDVLILETGLGGRFDATNVSDQPLLSIITSISKDHEVFLGDTLAMIAKEKAGIIKKGSSLVTSCSAPEAVEVIKQEFRDIQKGEDGPELFLVSDCCKWSTKSLGLAGQEVDLETPGNAYKALFLPLPGQYQCENLADVALAWEYLAGERSPLASGREQLTEEALRSGLASVFWPCRLELVQEKPTVVLDGSHNPDGILKSAQWLETERGGYSQVILVMGMLEDKDRISATSALDGLVSRVIITKPLSERAGQWQDLAKGFKSIPQEGVEFVEDCHEAVKKAIDIAGENDLVLCTGSFYLVGELRKNWKDTFA
ncbi:MAG: bifunctional folylpolyglutamate synthase/dihydrofolate synthase [Clostridiales bacterium]|nr:bifunctional folylpolyglutamate synthase/dihydrofolate synthase [Clostridiales bacterium]